MNEFIEKMMELGAMEASSKEEQQARIKEAEKLYDKHMDNLNLSPNAIENLVFNKNGSIKKRLKLVKNPHPMLNALVLMEVNGDYYEWKYLKD